MRQLLRLLRAVPVLFVANLAVHPVAAQARHGKIMYNGRVYPDAGSACAALLRDLNPPQKLRGARGPDEYGRIGCTGTDKKGDVGFDQEQTAVELVEDPAPDTPPDADAASQSPAQPPPASPPATPAENSEEPTPRPGLRVLLVGPETDAEFAYADRVRKAGGTAVAVNPVRSAAADRFAKQGGIFVQSTVERMPSSDPFDIIREDYPYPTGSMFGPAVDTVHARLARLRVGGRWSIVTEKHDFATTLEAAARTQGATVITQPLLPHHEGTPVSGHVRDPERYLVMVTRTR